MHADIEDEICENDKVVARVAMHGRHLARLGRQPTGKEYAAEQIHIWRIADGKVIDCTGPYETTSAKPSSLG
jgi:ketosteroid isomerase-like protein